ncbi:MAG: hypothetical protein VYE22_06860 [Myxococcota bacterium]|nr:hypothetical protein [Myxococcota bacterium]
MPSCDRRLRIGRICTVLLLLGVGGCTDAGTAACPGAPCYRGGDGGPADEADASADAGMQTPGPHLDAGALGDEASFGAGACFNGVNEDVGLDAEDDGADCDDASCASAAICCLGESDAACCVASPRVVHAFGDCDGVSGCAPGALVFGAPRVAADGLVPNGDESGDGGLALGEPLDLTRQRVTLTGRLRAEAECAEDCLEVAAFGVGDAPTLGRVLPDVAMALRPARREIALLVAGETLHAWRYDGAADLVVSLTLAPTGELTAGVEGMEPVSATFMPRADRRALIYGRTQSLRAEPARVMSLSVEASTCRMPSALDRWDAPEIPWGEPWAGQAPRSPSVLADDETLRLAFELDGSLFVAVRDPSGAWRMQGSDLDDPVLRAPAGTRYADPDLVRTEAGDFLLLTVESDGQTRLAVSGPVELASARFPDPRVLGEPDLRAPSAAVTPDGEVLIAAVRGRASGSRVLLFDSDPAFTSLSPKVEQPIVTASGELFRFDEQEVADPALMVDGDGLLRLYYAGRRGTRWALGLRASIDREHFREIGGGAPILTPSGSGFDALSVRAPDARWDGDAVELWFGAHSGAAWSIGAAVEAR